MKRGFPHPEGDKFIFVFFLLRRDFPPFEMSLIMRESEGATGFSLLPFWQDDTEECFSLQKQMRRVIWASL